MKKLYVFRNTYKSKWTCDKCNKKHSILNTELKTGSVVHCTTERCRGVAVVLPGKDTNRYYYK